MAETIRANKQVSGFGSSKLRKPWYLDWFPDSLHPFLTGLFRKDSNEWSKKENEQFEQAVSLAKKLKGVEGRMGLLNPDLDEEIDDPSAGDIEGDMIAYMGDGSRVEEIHPEGYSPSMEEIIEKEEEDEGDSALDVIALDDKRREDAYIAGLLESEDYMGTLGEDVYAGLSRDKYSDPDQTTLEMLADDRSLLSSNKLDYDPDDEAFDLAPGGSSGGAFFASGESGESGESGGKSKGLSPMQKYGAKLITDIFSEKEERPQQSIGASPIIPGRSMDMSKYVSSRRPKKDRYRNLGLLARGTV